MEFIHFKADIVMITKYVQKWFMRNKKTFILVQTIHTKQIIPHLTSTINDLSISHSNQCCRKVHIIA